MKTSEPSIGDYRKFAAILAAGILVIFLLIIPWRFESPAPAWPWYAASILAIWALALPTTLFVIYKPWMLLGSALGYINTRIILALTYYLILTPIGLLMKAFGKDPLRRKNSDTLETYWQPSQRAPKEQMERLY